MQLSPAATELFKLSVISALTGRLFHQSANVTRIWEATLYDHGGDVGSDLILDDVQQGEAWKIYIWHEEFTYSRNGATRVSYNDARANWVIIHKCGQPALPNPGSKPIKDALLLHNLRAWFAASAQVHTGKN